MKMTTIHTITTMHMKNQQQLPTRQSEAVNLTRQTNLNTRRRIWTPRDEFEHHETNLNTTRRIWIPRDGFEYNETDLNTTRRIWIPRDEFEYHKTNLSLKFNQDRYFKTVDKWNSEQRSRPCHLGTRLLISESKV